MKLIYSGLDELQHHGVKGMRWGVRRYQNKDGSLTATGRKKYIKYAKNNPVEQRKRLVNLMRSNADWTRGKSGKQLKGLAKKLEKEDSRTLSKKKLKNYETTGSKYVSDQGKGYIKLKDLDKFLKPSSGHEYIKLIVNGKKMKLDVFGKLSPL